MKDYLSEEGLEDQAISKINSAALINLRINELWKDANRHSRKGEHLKWNEDLDRVWMELVGDTKLDGEEDKTYKELTVAYSLACGEISDESKGFERVSLDQKKSIAKKKEALMKKEAFLRRLMNKQGKGTAYHDSSEDYMD